MNEKRLIDANALKEKTKPHYFDNCCYAVSVEDIDNAPTVDAVEVEKYNDLREAFVDYVCSGIQNPAPYCKNRHDGCVDSRGWCTYTHCNGFNPDGERKDNG